MYILAWLYFINDILRGVNATTTPFEDISNVPVGCVFQVVCASENERDYRLSLCHNRDVDLSFSANDDLSAAERTSKMAKRRGKTCKCPSSLFPMGANEDEILCAFS